MENATVLRPDDELLKDFCCPVCLEVMQCPPKPRTPKLLPCSHSICAECLDNLKKNVSNANCPICKATTPYLFGNFPNNTTMIRLMDTLNIAVLAKRMTCENCENHCTASFYCMECPCAYCEGCAHAHGLMKATKNHTLHKVEDLNDAHIPLPRNSSSDTMCEIHPDEKIDLFCESCDKLVCRNCIVLNHPKPNHNALFLGDAIVKYGGEMNASLQTCEETIAKMRLNLLISMKIMKTKYV